VAQAKITRQLLHMIRLKDIPNEPLPFTLEELTFVTGHDARRVLAAVLKHGQRIINVCSHVLIR
jgi:hypothetical protein